MFLHLPKQFRKMPNHRWKDNVCQNCGLVRRRQGWKLLMAITPDGKDHYKYGTGWYYGWPHKEMDTLIKGIGFKRPECKKNEQ